MAITESLATSSFASPEKPQPSSLQRELRQFTEAGILKRQQNGNRVYFQADKTCPVFSELAQILFKTVGVVEVLQKR